MSEANKAVVRRFYEDCLNERNLALLDEVLDPAYVYHGVIEGEIRGIEPMRQFCAELYRNFAGCRHVIYEQIAEGDKVVTRFQSTGTPMVEFWGVAPNGQAATVDEVAICRVVGGKIVEDWVLWDVHGLRRQLGAEPPLARGAK
jgi:predicted ester cyclase